MLLDPAEKGLDLPAASVELGDRQNRQMGVVGQEHQCLCGVGGFELDPPQLVRITFGTVDSGEHHGLVTDQPGVAINRMRVESSHLGVGFGAQHEVAAQAVEAMKPIEVKIGAVHHADGAEFPQAFQNQFQIPSNQTLAICFVVSKLVCKFLMV